MAGIQLVGAFDCGVLDDPIELCYRAVLCGSVAKRPQPFVIAFDAAFDNSAGEHDYPTHSRFDPPRCHLGSPIGAGEMPRLLRHLHRRGEQGHLPVRAGPQGRLTH